ncbi:hypothetical protein HC024_20025 [Methylococcaceae bacterium WWC4]|nr:hypothetical protein [Methylococcaceae bacterium WWC4]
MKTGILFSMAVAVVAISDTATAAVTTFSNYNIVSNNPYLPVSARFTDATANQTMVVNELANMPVGTIHSGDIINGITYAFSIFNRANPNLPNDTTGQVVNNAWSGFNPVLTPPGDGTAFQPGGLTQLNDSVTLTFSTPINSFGVSVVIALNSTFNISTDVAGVSASTNGINSYGDLTGSNQRAFLGLVSDTPFSSVTLTGGNRYMGGTVKAWSGWDVSRITYGVMPVPAPAAWLLLLSGLAWGGVMRRFSPRSR